MTQAIESYYPKICQVAVDCTPIDYVKIWVASEVGDGFCGAEIFIQSPDGSFFYTTEGASELSDLIFELHGKWKESPAWTTATFSVNSDGKFSADFGYDAIPDFDMELELQRRENWIRNHLGKDAVVNYTALAT
jgi:hypothetical protein